MGKCKLSLCIVEALIYKLHAMFDLKAGVSESGFVIVLFPASSHHIFSRHSSSVVFIGARKLLAREN